MMLDGLGLRRTVGGRVTCEVGQGLLPSIELSLLNHRPPGPLPGLPSLTLPPPSHAYHGLRKGLSILQEKGRLPPPLEGLGNMDSRCPSRRSSLTLDPHTYHHK